MTGLPGRPGQPGLPRPRATHLTRVAAALAAAALVLAPTAAAADRTPTPSPTPTSTAATDDDADPVTVVLDQVGPAVVEPASVVVVRGTLTNAGDVPLPVGTEVDLRVQRSQLSTRESVRDWAGLALDGAVGSLVSRQVLATEVPPGGRMPVEFSVPAADLQLDPDPDEWGPRGLSLLVRQSDGTRLGAARTPVVWWPSAQALAEVRPTLVTVLLPLTGGAPDPATGVVPAERVDERTADGAPWDAVLDAAAVPGTVVALDPAVLVSPGTTPTSTAWATRLREVLSATSEPPVLLPYGDADLTALVDAGATDLARLAADQARDAAQRELGSAVRTDVAWPADGTADPAALAALRDLGWSAAVLAESAVPPQREPADTLTGRADVEVPGDDAGGRAVAAVVADGALSRELAAVDDPPAGTPDGTSPAASVQLLLAETAAVTLEGGPSRHLLVAAPRDWAPAGPDAAAATAALTSVPWASGAGLQALLDTAPPDVTREAPAAGGGGLTAAGLEQVRSDLAEVGRLATALADPDATTTDATRAAVSLTSAGWRDDAAGWDAAVDAFGAGVDALRTGVRVVPGSPVTQVSREVQLPVTVQNDLAEDVSVVLGVRSTSNRLVITRDVEVVVPAGATQTAYVPVRGVGSGQAVVVSQLRAPSGAAFDRPVETRVTVRADWETRGVLALAVVAGLVLVGGLVRAVLRGRRPRGRDPLAEGPSGPGDPPRDDA